MKGRYFFLSVLLVSCLCMTSSALCATAPVSVVPDTVGNADGWRYATAADATHWANVDVGDVILFGKVKAEPDLGGQPVRSISVNYTIDIANVHKIHIYRGDYSSIFLRVGPGALANDNSTEANPIVITNLGGQVKFGGWGRLSGVTPRFDISGLKHVVVTGEYNTTARTGHTDYRGLDADLTQRGWINRFGFQGDQHYAEYNRGRRGGLGVVARSFVTFKIRGVAVLHGYFTGFSLKSDDLSTGQTTKIDVQKCLSGWHDGEGFYIGSTSPVNSRPTNQVICKNNVALFSGAELIQVDKAQEGTRISHNFAYKSGCWYQDQFQGAHYQENTLQWDFVQGDVRAEDNIFYGGGAGSMVTGASLSKSAWLPHTPGTEIVLQNNLFGPSRRYIGRINPSQDAGKIINFRYHRNVFDSVTVPATNDAYPTETIYETLLAFSGTQSPLYLTGNIYPDGKPLYEKGTVISTAGSDIRKAPRLLMHEHFGFDPKEILNLRGVWLAVYGDSVPAKGPITYRQGDMVYTWKANITRYYRCIQTHHTPQDPTTAPAYWQKITWDGHDEPIYTPLLQPNTYYNYRGMGLEANPANTTSADTLAPVITTQTEYHYRINNTFALPTYTAADNRDGNITGEVKRYWKNGSSPVVNANQRLTQHGTYELILQAEDDAGNRAEPVTVKVVVSDAVVNLTGKSQLNLHRNNRAQLTTPGSYWLDIAGDNEGLKNANAEEPIRSTRSVLKDTMGTDLTWALRIDDGTAAAFYSAFGGGVVNSTWYAIGDFPGPINRTGLQLRQSIEDECHILFRNLDPARYYDFRFTGLRTNTTGKVIVGVADSVSGQKVTFNVVNNTQTYALTNIQPDAQGNISLIHTLDNNIGAGATATSLLSGFIIIEKDAYGIIGSAPVDPGPSADARTVQIHVTYAGSPALTTPGQYWSKLTVANSNSTYSANNLTAKDGTTATPIDVSVTKNGSEGFNYSNGVNTGLTTGDNSGAVPDAVLQYFAVANDQPANLVLSGLNTGKTYTIQTLSNGRSIWEGLSRDVAVTVQGVTQIQAANPAGGNTDELLTWNNVTPSGGGQITVTVAGLNQTYGILNAVIAIEETTGGGGGGLPEQTVATTDNLRLYPIPAKGGVLNVTYEPVDAKSTGHGPQATAVASQPDVIRAVRIVDTTGRLQNTRVISAEANAWSVDISTLRGFYIIGVDTGKGTLYKTFVAH